MSINGATPIVGGTYAVPTSGTADTLSAVGNQNSMEAVFDGDTEYLTQKSISFSCKSPTVSANAPNGYTQARRSAFLQFPEILDNANRTVNSIRIELGVDYEMTAAEIAEYCLIASQVLADPDYAAFWQLGRPE
jgi:hypothetical protein